MSAAPAAGEPSKHSSALPEDVYPASGFRLPLPKREDLDDFGKTVYDKIVDPARPKLAGLRGPSGIRLHSPILAEKANALSRFLRFESGLSGPVRELAILVTAREMDCQFEWTAHEPSALKEGIPRETIDIVKYRRDAAGLTELESVIVRLGREMFGERRVSSEIFAHALDIFGPKQLVELVSLMTNYSATAALLRAFDMQLSPDEKPLLPLTSFIDS